jgi:hypothetical protein
MRPSLLWLILLSGCIIQPVEQAKPEAAAPSAAVTHPLPAPVYPDECVANWYAKTSLPPCVESWITDVTKEQKVIARKHKRKAHQTAPHKP